MPCWLKPSRIKSRRPCGAMTTLVSSVAAFRQRAAEVGMEQDLLNAQVNAGFDTLSKFAFCDQQPGRPIDDAGFARFLNGLRRDNSLAQVAVCKRLLFESHTLIIHSLKERVESSDSAPIRKINAAERDSRLEAQAARLAGVRLKGDLEVAFGVLDAVNDQAEKKQIKYLAPHKCPKRESEILSAKPGQKVTLDANGSLTIKAGESSLQCDARRIQNPRNKADPSIRPNLYQVPDTSTRHAGEPDFAGTPCDHFSSVVWS